MINQDRVRRSAISIAALLLVAVGLFSCRKPSPPLKPLNLPNGVRAEEKSFYSSALSADVTYTVIAAKLGPFGESKPLHVVYVLHGNGSSHREWAESSGIAQLAAEGYTLVMPEGHGSYFMNSATKANDRYEDFLTSDLIVQVEGQPATKAHVDRSIIGVSMGGFAAIVLGLGHPDLYRFIGALSPPVDVPERAFSFHRIGQSIAMRSIFGPPSSPTRKADDPFLLAKTIDPAKAAYIFLSAGESEPLRPVVERFEAQLTRHHIAHTFQLKPGGHDWDQWNQQIPFLISSLRNHQGDLRATKL